MTSSAAGGASSKFNVRNPAVKRILQEIKELQSSASPDFIADALEEDIFEWHFVIRGPPDTEFEGGLYHGRILLPSEYPFKPPAFMMLTPNGRFQTGTKICLSISSHHPEHWQPSWSVRTALTALIAFMPSPGQGALGSLDFSKDERRQLAAKSRSDIPKFGGAARQAVTDEMHARFLALQAAAAGAGSSGGGSAGGAAAAAAAAAATPRAAATDAAAGAAAAAPHRPSDDASVVSADQGRAGAATQQGGSGGGGGSSQQPQQPQQPPQQQDVFRLSESAGARRSRPPSPQQQQQQQQQQPARAASPAGVAAAAAAAPGQEHTHAAAAAAAAARSGGQAGGDAGLMFLAFVLAVAIAAILFKKVVVALGSGGDVRAVL